MHLYHYSAILSSVTIQGREERMDGMWKTDKKVESQDDYLELNEDIATHLGIYMEELDIISFTYHGEVAE